MKQYCPCHSGQTYTSCCQSLHLGKPAKNAEQLMRSRYSAYVLKMADYLNATQHASKSSTIANQGKLNATDFLGIKWLGLEILDTQIPDLNRATVTFKARFRNGKQKTLTLHETSHFIFENGYWFYADGEIHSN
jgi:SEC-C motif-containing protein